MKLLLDKSEYTLNDIQSLIDNKAEENTYLEFKDAATFRITPVADLQKIKREIGKDVSAFANSDGGLIIYGLKEDKNRQADEITWINITKHSKDWLQQVIESNTSRPVTNVIIHQIQNPTEPTEQIYVVKVLPSSHAPHMTKDHIYYRRNSAGNVIMEEYEVRMLYNQIAKTDLEILDIVGHNMIDLPIYGGIGLRPSIQHTFNFQIKNFGNAIEHHYKLEIHFTEALLLNYSDIHKFKQRVENGLSVYSVPNIAPLFQNETISIKSIDIKFDKVNYHLYDNGKIILRLHYSNGIKEKEFILKELLQYKLLPIPKDSL